MSRIDSKLDKITGSLSTDEKAQYTVSTIVEGLEEAMAGEVTIEGHAAVSPAGRAVVVHTRMGSFIIPLVSFQRVARGEAASAPLFPLVPEVEL